MSTTGKFFRIQFVTLMVIGFHAADAQDKISWLDNYISEMQIGSETYQYNFTNVEGNDCKLKFEELHTDKKGCHRSPFLDLLSFRHRSRSRKF